MAQWYRDFQRKAVSVRFSGRGIAVGMLWLTAIGAGMGALAWYDNSPAASEGVVRHWPSGSLLERDDQRATLVLFAHPRCPCTRASLGELEKIVAHSQGTITPWVVFFKADDAPEGWEQTDLWRSASAIPGVRVACDPGGREARCFQATTSGQTLVFSAAGDLLFSGGITFARGHAGDNAGRAAIEACAAGQQPAARQTPVFGCPIVVASQPR